MIKLFKLSLDNLRNRCKNTLGEIMKKGEKSGFRKMNNLEEEILKSEVKNKGARELYRELHGRCYGESNQCFLSQNRLAKTLGVTVKTIQNYLKTLCEKGFIIINVRGSEYGTNLYTLVPKAIFDEYEKENLKVVPSNSNKTNIKRVQPKLKGDAKKSVKEPDFEQRKYDFGKLEQLLVFGNDDYSFSDCVVID